MNNNNSGDSSVNENNHNSSVPIVIENNNDITTTINLNLNQQLTNINLRLKFTVFFIILILLKLLVDNLACSLILISGTYLLLRMKREFNIQLSNKKKSNIKMLIVLSIFAGTEIFFLIFFSKLIGSPKDFVNRLFLSYSIFSDKNNIQKNSITLQNVIWCALVIDNIMQNFILIIKVSFCIIFDLRMGNFFIFSGYYCFKGSGSSRLGYSNLNISDAYDNAESNNNRSSIYSNASSTDSSQTGLARRSPTHNNNNNNNIDDNLSDNNSDDSTVENKSYRYLRKLRICSIIDILGLVYRSLLPLPLWFGYFSYSSIGSSAFTYIYVCYKITEVIYKIRGAVEGIEIYLSNQTEFGHYSTPEELVTATECPVCFDSHNQMQSTSGGSSNKPITLGCKHIFCEMCISEWLDKEKTCPVCRSEVNFTSENYESAKEQANSILPIVS